METGPSEAAKLAAKALLDELGVTPDLEAAFLPAAGRAFEGYGQHRDERIRELELDQETLFDDVERLNGCLTRAYEIRRSSQERLKSARAEIIRLRGQLRGDAPGAPAGEPAGEAASGDE